MSPYNMHIYAKWSKIQKLMQEGDLTELLQRFIQLAQQNHIHFRLLPALSFI